MGSPRVDQSAIDQAQLWADADPQVQALLHDQARPFRPREFELQRLAQGHLPPGYYVNMRTGKVEYDDGTDWTRWALGAGALAGGAALGGAFAGLGGGAGGGGAAGGSAAFDLGPALDGGASFGGSAAAGLGPALDGGASVGGSGAAADLAGGGEWQGPPAPAGGGASNPLARLFGGGNGAGSNGFGADDLIKLLGVGGLTAQQALSNHGPAYPPELDQILKLQRQRMESQTPLYDSILKLSQSRLPTGQS